MTITFQPKPTVIGLPMYEPGKPIAEVQREYGLQDVIKLASNENPFGFSPRVRTAIQEALSSLPIYPDGAARELRAALASFYRVNEAQVMVGNGSDELVSLITRAYLQPGTETIMAAPTFPRYKTNALIEGAKVLEIPCQDGRHDLAGMLDAVNERTRVIWICNPNNPTGCIVTSEELEHFLQQVPENVLVVMDEAYYEYVTSDAYPDTLALLPRYPNLIILRTFSKIYGLAALRVGYAIAQADVLDPLHRVREPFNVNHLGQVAALAALQDQAFVSQCRTQNREGMQQILQGIEQLGLTAYPSEANFLFIHLQRPAGPVFEGLLRQGVIVRSGEALGNPTGLRVTIGSREQNERFLAALENVLSDYGG